MIFKARKLRLHSSMGTLSTVRTAEAWGDLTALVLSRGRSLSACHSCHSPRPSGDTGIVAWHHPDPELPGACKGLRGLWVSACSSVGAQVELGSSSALCMKVIVPDLLPQVLPS